MNGMYWGCEQYVSDKSILRDAFIAIESLRNGMTVLWTNLGAWLAHSLDFIDYVITEDTQRLIYTLLTPDVQLQQELQDLQLRFESGRLKCAAHLQLDPDTPQRVTEALEKCWLIRQFSDTRWSTLGTSSQIIMLLLYTGMPDLVRFSIEQATTSDYHIRGFLRCSTSVKQMAALVLTSTHLSRALVEMFLEDDRLMVILPAVDTEMLAELQFTSGIHEDAWNAFATLVGFTRAELRHLSISSTVVQAGFFRWRTRNATQPPWTMTQGDLRQNLQDLRDEPDCPDEEVMRKIWMLLKIQFPEKDLLDGLTLMRNCSMSTKTEEEGHKVPSVLMKLHHKLGEEQMRARSMVGMIRPLVLPSKQDERLRRLREQLARLKRRQPQRITGRHAYVESLAACAKTIRGGVATTNKNKKLLFANHGKFWKMLPEPLKVQYGRQAERMQDASRDELSQKCAEVNFKIDGEEAWCQKKADQLRPLRLGSCRFTHSQRLKLLAYINNAELTWDRVEASRDHTCMPVGQPDVLRTAAIERIPVHVEPSVYPRERLPWLSMVCKNRNFFKDCCFKFSTPHGDIVLKFVFAVQNPLLICFHRLATAVQASLSSSSASAASRGVFGDRAVTWELEYDCDWTTWIYSDEDTIESAWPLFILTDCQHLGGGRLGSDSSWASLATVADWLGDVEQPADAGEEDEPIPPEPLPTDDVFTLCPWLLTPEYWPSVEPQDIDFDTATAVRSGRRRAGGADMNALDFGDLHDMALDQLLIARAALAELGDAVGSDVRIVLRGGKWTMAAKGVAYDSVRAEVYTTLGLRWAAHFDVNKTASFYISTYGEAVAHRLAALWKHKVQWLINIWVAEGERDGCYLALGLLDSYPEPRDAADLYGLGVVHVTARVNLVRALQPRML